MSNHTYSAKCSCVDCFLAIVDVLCFGDCDGCEATDVFLFDYYVRNDHRRMCRDCKAKDSKLKSFSLQKAERSLLEPLAKYKADVERRKKEREKRMYSAKDNPSYEGTNLPRYYPAGKGGGLSYTIGQVQRFSEFSYAGDDRGKIVIDTALPLESLGSGDTGNYYCGHVEMTDTFLARKIFSRISKVDTEARPGVTLNHKPWALIWCSGASETGYSKYDFRLSDDPRELVEVFFASDEGARYKEAFSADGSDGNATSISRIAHIVLDSNIPTALAKHVSMATKYKYMPFGGNIFKEGDYLSHQQEITASDFDGSHRSITSRPLPF